MRQLNGLDHLFFDMEAGGSPMILSTLDIYNVAGMRGRKPGFSEVIRVFESRFDRLHMLAMKLRRVPLGLDHPYWVEDADFKLRSHFHRIKLPAPGNWKQLMERVSALQNVPFAPDRPMWEAYVVEGLNAIEGLAPGSFALFMRMHHALADGAVTMAIRDTIHDRTRKVASARAAHRLPVGETVSDRELLVRACRNAWKASCQSARILRGVLPAIGRLGSAAIRNYGESALAGMAPASPPPSLLNPRRMSRERLLDMRRFEFERVRAVRTLVEGATINDVATAIMAGAMRHFLLSRGELPAAGMNCIMSVNLRREDESDRGNIVSQMTVPVYVDVNDPLERLRLIRAASARMKVPDVMALQRGAAELMMSLPSLAMSPPVRVASMLTGRLGRAQASTALSNVPSFMEPRYLAGARLAYLMGYGMLMPSVGIGHSVTIYDGWMMFGMVSCPEVMDETVAYMRCLEQSFAEYVVAVEHAGATRRRRSVKRRAASAKAA